MKEVQEIEDDFLNTFEASGEFGFQKVVWYEISLIEYKSNKIDDFRQSGEGDKFSFTIVCQHVSLVKTL